MVDRINLDQVNALYAEMNAIIEGMNRLDHGGRIVMMFISTAEGVESGIPTQVPTRTIAYPPQMITGIKQQLTQRLHEIEDELADLGLTGVTPQPRGTEPPAQRRVRR